MRMVMFMVASGYDDHNFGSLFGFAADCNLPAVSIDDAFDDCHSQPGPLGLRCIKGVKNPLSLLGDSNRARYPESKSEELIDFRAGPASRR